MYPNPVNPISGIFVHNQVKALIRSGVDVCVLSPTPSFPLYSKWNEYPKSIKKVIHDEVPVFYVPTRMFPGGLLFSQYGRFYIKALRSVMKEIQSEFPFDVIHCHTIYPDGFAGVNLKGKFDVPIVTTIHGSDIMLYPGRNKKVYNHTKKALLLADQIIAVSGKLLQEAEKIQPELNGKLIYNGFSSDYFYPMDQLKARQDLGLEESGKRILFVGNLYPVKGLTYLLRAFKYVLRHVPGVILDIVGDGSLRSELEAQAREWGLANNVLFHGKRPYDQIPLWINSADVVALSSLSEGLPSILLETMGCGKVMVATDVGGIDEILVHGETGYLCPPEDVDCLGNDLKKVLDDEESTKKMGQNAYEVSQQLTWRRNAGFVKNVYMGIIDRK